MKTNIEIILGEWGTWKRGENRHALGYPDAASFTEEYVDGKRRSDPTAFMVDDDLRRLDRHIQHIHADYRSILIAHYVGTGPVKVKADKLSTSVRVYYTVLEHAHRMLAHLMGGRYATGFEPKLCAHLDQVCA